MKIPVLLKGSPSELEQGLGKKDGELAMLVHYDNDGTAHIVTLDALVDALEEAKTVGRKTDCCIRCITVASRTPN
jgi:hypothetical protein